MGEGTRKAIIILICGILMGLLLGAAIFLFIHGDKLK